MQREGCQTDITKDLLSTVLMSQQDKPPGKVGRLSGTGRKMGDRNGDGDGPCEGEENWLKRLCHLWSEMPPPTPPLPGEPYL